MMVNEQGAVVSRMFRGLFRAIAWVAAGVVMSYVLFQDSPYSFLIVLGALIALVSIVRIWRRDLRVELADARASYVTAVRKSRWDA
ncbi:hypothetical protein D5S17_02355 [Pseudonocardiaceae bacterium YIM PH 21723]|nr:hypothetical protein D5S17_02355 [Pseudonocardiaceae bacterium YIM PH 21723]